MAILVFKFRFASIHRALQPLSPLRRRVCRHSETTDAPERTPCALDLGDDSADDHASEKAILKILTQPDDDGVHHQVNYESRKLTAAEQARPAYVLKLLAVAQALRVFRHYLQCSAAGRLGLTAFARTSFSALTIMQSHGSVPDKTSIDSSPTGWTNSKSFALK